MMGDAMINIQSSLQKPKVSRLMNAIRQAFDQTNITPPTPSELVEAYGIGEHRTTPAQHFKKRYDRSYAGVEILEYDDRTVKNAGAIEVYKLVGDNPVGMWGCFENGYGHFRYLWNREFPGLDAWNCTVMGNLENAKKRIIFGGNINIVFKEKTSISFNADEPFHAPLGFSFQGLERVN